MGRLGTVPMAGHQATLNLTSFTFMVPLGVSAALIPIAGVFQVFDGLQVVPLGVLRGLGDTRVPAVVGGILALRVRARLAGPMVRVAA